uniref:NAD-dependent epimerase/dehydratase domain-containing protein n=1 Tax=Fagus sylvatica TaxID=28930 RepID=A0A2N9GNF9_FAGSY
MGTIACVTPTLTFTPRTRTQTRTRTRTRTHRLAAHFSKPSYYFPLSIDTFRFETLCLAPPKPQFHYETLIFDGLASPSPRFLHHWSLSLFLSAEGAANEELGAASSGLVGENDLLIVGPGVLGRLVAEKWRESQVTGNADLSTVETLATAQGETLSSTVERLAALNWNGEGSFLFTSSSAPYDCNDNGPCDEDTPVVPIGRSPRTDVLLKAEKVVLEYGGCVLRLAGLYISFLILELGAHSYWLEKGTVEARPDHILNLIHYEDAASLAIAILKKKFRGRIFLGCDNHPLSRQEVMDLVTKSGKFSKKFEGFTGTSDPLGKRLNNSKTREEIGWEPRYRSFSNFLGLSE